MKAGVDVHRATSAFSVAGKSYPAGSYVMKTAQAFRAHLLDMFEPQNHPDDIPYPGAPPRAPYDVTGYNIAYSMGITFDRILDGFDGPFEKLPDLVKPPVGRVPAAAKGGGYLLSHAANDSFSVVNRLLKSNEAVYSHRDGFFIPWERAGGSRSSAELQRRKACSFDAAGSVNGTKLAPVRIGLWDRYGGSMPSGWTRWILERSEFPFEVVHTRRPSMRGISTAGSTCSSS